MSKNRVLLVDDNTDKFELVRFLLERTGYQVLAAYNRQKGQDLARQELPDLILIDLSLPGVDGWTAARELKANPKTASIPLLALTAHALPGDRNRTLESGFIGYVSKPINLQNFTDENALALQANKTSIKN